MIDAMHKTTVIRHKLVFEYLMVMKTQCELEKGIHILYNILCITFDMNIRMVVFKDYVFIYVRLYVCVHGDFACKYASQHWVKARKKYKGKALLNLYIRTRNYVYVDIYVWVI